MGSPRHLERALKYKLQGWGSELLRGMARNTQQSQSSLFGDETGNRRSSASVSAFHTRLCRKISTAYLGGLQV